MNSKTSNPLKPSSPLQDFLLTLRSSSIVSVSLLSFSSGLPLGLVWIAIPDWMRSIGVDIRIIGILSLTQAPWTLKVFWSPLMDRYVPPFWGRRRGWIAITQLALAFFTLLLAGVGSHPDTPWVVGAIAFCIAFFAASQDIALDAYAVEVLTFDEQGIAVGARSAIYRAAMFVAGGLSITIAGKYSWALVNCLLALTFLPLLFLTWKSPEPQEKIVPPQTLKEAVFQPLIELFSRSQAMEILIFVILYKLSDNLGQALLRPFLVDMGYSSVDRGVALSTIGLVATLTGTFLGGILTTLTGLGHSLWLCGFLQVFSNIGYVFLAAIPINRLFMYSALGFESFTQGLGTGAFSVLLFRLTQKRFSATQFALLTGLFSLVRVFAGPLSGFLVKSVGWTAFFWLTIIGGIPGLVFLARFCPLGVREPLLGQADSGIERAKKEE